MVDTHPQENLNPSGRIGSFRGWLGFAQQHSNPALCCIICECENATVWTVVLVKYVHDVLDNVPVDVGVPVCRCLRVSYKLRCVPTCVLQNALCAYCM